jgi:hypothetical protein
MGVMRGLQPLRDCCLPLKQSDSQYRVEDPLKSHSYGALLGDPNTLVHPVSASKPYIQPSKPLRVDFTES